MNPFFLKSLQFNTQATDPGLSTASGRSVRLELFIVQPLPAGWFLLRGLLHRKDTTSSARLTAVVKDLEGQSTSFPISVSRKGTIFDLIYLPKGVTRCSLEFMCGGELELSDMSLAPVCQVERIARMYRRVVPMLFKQSRARRQKVGFHSYTPFIDLQKAYRIASRFRDYVPELSYEKWLDEYDTLADNDRRMIRRIIKRWTQRPLFKIFIVVREGQEDYGLKGSIESLRRQLYRKFSVTLLIHPQVNLNVDLIDCPSWLAVYKSNSSNDLVEFVNAKARNNEKPAWTVVMSAGSLLSEHALYWLSSEALSNADTAFIYSDHDTLNSDGTRSEPVFKPAWSPELLRSNNYIGCPAAIRSDVLINAGGLSLSDLRDDDKHDLFLRISEQVNGGGIRHIPAILWHLPKVAPERATEDIHRKANPVRKHLRRLGVAATVEQTSSGHHRVRYKLSKKPPKISILVPTRDALEHLHACIESVLETSSYRNFELLVIDNQSCKPTTLAYLEEARRKPQVRVLRFNRPFNYSAINNFAVRHAKGEVLCLLNNDTKVITADWMEEMLGHLLQPGVGVVGAKLYYSDGRVQHAGDTVGPGGCAHHLHAMIERDNPGYCNRAILAQDLSAVTAACLMTWRSLYNQVGGLNRKNLPITFNDVDYCLKVRELGHRVVWTPHAELYHHESVSRGKDPCPKKDGQMKREVAYMRRRWGHLMAHDPFYNPNLSYDRPDFSLNVDPLVKKPWQK